MGKERSKEWYDGIYKKSKRYNLPYNKIVDFDLFKGVCNLLGKNFDIKILELGCGTGRLAELIRTKGYKNYVGLDFSKVAIEMAKDYVKDKNYLFLNNSIFDKSVDRYIDECDIIISTEVLEHIVDDIEVLKKIPSGKPLIFSVPSFKAKAHVRIFPTEKSVRERYGKLLYFYKDKNTIFQHKKKERIKKYLFYTKKI